MVQSLAGKIALVTGGSRGIGRAIALKLAEQGAKVVVNFVRHSEEADAVVKAIGDAGGQALAVQADLSKVDQVEALFEETVDHFGELDILVNNAGMAIFKPVAELTEADYQQLFAINVKGVFFACQQAAQKMADGGRIINISSTVTRVMLPNYALYGASKAALEALTRSLAKELGPRGITVNCLAPGPTDTELFREGKSAQQIAQLASMAAFGRLGTPQDIAAAVSLLAGPDAGWISGQTICANGGFAA